MGVWFGGLEEGVRQLPHPHGDGGGHDCVFGVHHGVKQRFQVGLRVSPDVHDLVSRRGVAAVLLAATGDQMAVVAERLAAAVEQRIAFLNNWLLLMNHLLI